MILIDTSAWFAFFRGTEPTASFIEELLEENQVAICGPVQTEILRGLAPDRDRQLVLPLLSGCRILAQPDDLWVDAGNCGFLLRRKGKTCKSMDLLIACYAMAHSVGLLTLDSDFAMMRKAGLNIDLVEAR